jgi:hypothetical protein
MLRFVVIEACATISNRLQDPVADASYFGNLSKFEALAALVCGIEPLGLHQVLKGSKKQP